MHKLLILLTIFICGCSSRTSVNLILKEHDNKLTDPKGIPCVESNYHVLEAVDKTYHTLTTTFSNCDVKVVRKMLPNELKMWGVK